MQTRWRIELLGRFRACWGEHELSRFPRQKAADRHPTGVMEKQPEPAADAVAILGADPNLRRVFEKPTVFTGPQLYGYFSYIPLGVEQ